MGGGGGDSSYASGFRDCSGCCFGYGGGGCGWCLLCRIYYFIVVFILFMACLKV